MDGDIVTRVKLPENVTCSQCVLQWRYHTENSWGSDERGSCLGCGPQEEFYGCSDIAILSSGVPYTAPTVETSTLSASLSSSPTGGGRTETTTEVTTGMAANKEATTPNTDTTGTTTVRTTLATDSKGTTTVQAETTTEKTGTTTAPSTKSRSCVSIAVNAEDKWCNLNCNHTPTFCPRNLCYCT